MRENLRMQQNPNLGKWLCRILNTPPPAARSISISVPFSLRCPVGTMESEGHNHEHGHSHAHEGGHGNEEHSTDMQVLFLAISVTQKTKQYGDEVLIFPSENQKHCNNFLYIQYWA